MNSRERVRAALRHEETDRVPIEFGAHLSSSASLIAYLKLKKHLGLETPTHVIHVWGLVPEIEMEVLDRVHADVAPLHRYRSSLGLRNTNWKEVEIATGDKVLVPGDFNPVTNKEGNYEWHENGMNIAVMPSKMTHGFTLLKAPLEEAHTKEEVDAFFQLEEGNFISRIKVHDDEIEWLKKKAKHLRETTDKAILGGLHQTVLENAQGILGWGDFFVRVLMENELFLYFMEQLTEHLLENLKKYLDAVGEYLDVIIFGDDLGAQSGGLITNDWYRENIFPYHKQLFEYVRNNHPDIYVMFHCDGSITDMIPSIIEAGVQVYNPVQTDAADMNPAMLKREYGKDLVFWGGGGDTHWTIPFGAPEQIREDVRRRMQILAPGGGFVFNQIHNILGETPPENVLMLYDAAYELGKYPIDTGGKSLDALDKDYESYWASPQNTFEKLDL